MAFNLGKDGKERAMNASTGKSVASLGTVYMGLLDTFPLDAEGMDAATLLANEASITSFYTPSDRKAITIGNSETATSVGAVATNSASVSWTNNSGASVEVIGLFVTDVSTGNGEILWVGTPDLSANFEDGEAATVAVDGMTLRID